MNNKHKYSTIVLIVLVAIIGGGIAISELIPYSSVQCTGTDKLSNVSFNGTNINGVCTADQTGGGSVNGTSINVSQLLINGTDVNDLLYSRYNEFAYLRVLEDDQCGVQTTTGEAWYGTGIGSGTTTTSTGYSQHPCIRALRSSTTASSGYSLNIGVTNLLLAGNESTDIIFNAIQTTGNYTNGYFGFIDTVSATPPVDGVYFNKTNNTFRGSVRTNNVQYNTTTEFTQIPTEFYRLIVHVVNTTQAYFYIYNSTNVTGLGNTNLVWSDSINATLPTASGRQTGQGVAIWKNGATTAQDLLFLDYMNVKIDRMLNR
jgi:NADH:ubiquinone oxidoreductase subunit